MSEIQVTSINGMGAITDLGGGSFSTTGMEANDHMHISEDFINNAGVVNTTNFLVTQASTPGKKVTVSGGIAYVLNADFSDLSLSEQKYWRVKMSGDTDVTITDNISGNPRIDVICIKVDPTATPDGEATNVASLVAVVGTPAASPTAPATPDHHLKLAEVEVSNGFSSIVNADITDYRDVVSLNDQSGEWKMAEETWTRTGNHEFTVVGDMTSKYRKGVRVRYKDGGNYEYGVVVASSYSSPNTTVTLATNTDYTMANTTITDRYTSCSSNPIGYPDWFNYTAVVTASGGTPPTYTQLDQAKFNITGKECSFYFDKSNSSGGTAGSGSVVLYVSTPVPMADSGDSLIGNFLLQNGGSGAIGLLRYGSPSTVFLMKYDFTFYNAVDQNNAVRIIHGKAFYQI